VSCRSCEPGQGGDEDEAGAVDAGAFGVTGGEVTPGTPVDNQISTYLVDYDVFVTADRAFTECVELLRPYSPARLARTSVSPVGRAAVDHLLDLFSRIAEHQLSAEVPGEA
jgi:hypothetical protein